MASATLPTLLTCDIVISFSAAYSAVAGARLHWQSENPPQPLRNSGGEMVLRLEPGSFHRGILIKQAEELAVVNGFNHLVLAYEVAMKIVWGLA